MESERIKAKLRALDNMQAYLDDRDAEDAKRLKEKGIVRDLKGSDAGNDDENGGLGDKSPPEDGEDTSSTQDAEDYGQSDEGESDDMDDDAGAEDAEGSSFMEELKGMAKQGSLDSKNALSMLEDDEDEEPGETGKLMRKGK